MDFSKLDFSTSSYHNSTNTGPIDMFFTKKYNYFSQETRWNHPFLSQSQRKGCNYSLKLTSDFICRRLQSTALATYHLLPMKAFVSMIKMSHPVIFTMVFVISLKLKVVILLKQIVYVTKYFSVYSAICIKVSLDLRYDICVSNIQAKVGQIQAL